jgi:hypothetical protein
MRKKVAVFITHVEHHDRPPLAAGKKLAELVALSSTLSGRENDKLIVNDHGMTHSFHDDVTESGTAVEALSFDQSHSPPMTSTAGRITGAKYITASEIETGSSASGTGADARKGEADFPRPKEHQAQRVLLLE